MVVPVVKAGASVPALMVKLLRVASLDNGGGCTIVVVVVLVVVVVVVVVVVSAATVTVTIYDLVVVPFCAVTVIVIVLLPIFRLIAPEGDPLVTALPFTVIVA